MPNSLQEFYKKNIAEPRKALQDSTPDHLDPTVSDKQIHEAVYRKMELMDYENGFFLPLTTAKQAVASAVREKDLKALADAVREYDRIEQITDDMMDTLRSDKLSDEPFFSSNVNSTRSSAIQIPAKYIPDLPNHMHPDRDHKYAWWDGHAAVQSMIRDPGGADFRELARRNARVVEEAEQERQLSGSFDSGFSPDLYLLHAYSAQSRLLRNAAGALRKNPGFQSFVRGKVEDLKPSQLSELIDGLNAPEVRSRVLEEIGAQVAKQALQPGKQTELQAEQPFRIKLRKQDPFESLDRPKAPKQELIQNPDRPKAPKQDRPQGSGRAQEDFKRQLEQKLRGPQHGKS